MGQGCKSQLDGIPTNLLGSTTYYWTVTGNTFQSWTISADSTRATLVGDYYVGRPYDPTEHWYWSDKTGPQTVTCKATVTPPTGQGAPFAITATKTVGLIVPLVTENATTGRVQINNLSQPIYGAGYWLYAGGNANQPYGIVYTTQVNTPAPFSAGVWNMVQLVTPGTWYTPKGQVEKASPGNGAQGLDTRYPFYPSSSSTYPTGVPANNLMAQPYDGPGVGSLVDTNVRYRVSDNYSTYVMFLPSGGDTQWVPLWDIGWNWNGDDAIPGISWTNWSNATDAGIVRVGSTISTINHPTWNTIIH